MPGTAIAKKIPPPLMPAATSPPPTRQAATRAQLPDDSSVNPERRGDDLPEEAQPSVQGRTRHLSVGNPDGESINRF